MVGCRRIGADGPDHGSGHGDRARDVHRALAARIRFRGRGSLPGEGSRGLTCRAQSRCEGAVCIAAVTDAQQCEQAVDDLKPYGLVNNAGVSASGAIEDVRDEDARLAFETMVLGPMRLARLAAPHMRAQGEGRIVNISSIYGLITTPLTGWYQASKHALEALSDALRVELASDGIAVVLIEPGAFRSNIWESASTDVRRPADSEYFTAYHRLDEGIKASQRLMGDPIEVARLIASMMTAKRPKARYLVGYDARAIDIYSKVLPTEVRDRLARLTLGL